jgi:cobalt/nickel transport system permease protein
VHHVVLEHWSRRASLIHTRDARVKFAATLIFLILTATTPPDRYPAFAGYFALVIAAIGIARLPLASVLLRAGAVLPFSLMFAAVSWTSGDSTRATALILRSYISAAAVLLLVSTTRLPDLLRALQWFRVPGLLILIAQFLYRYLFVLSEQAQHMRLAARCRTGAARSQGARRSRFHAAAGALSVLFARSYMRADGIHRAMLARGFSGHFPSLTPQSARWADALFLLIAIVIPLGIRTLA